MTKTLAMRPGITERGAGGGCAGALAAELGDELGALPLGEPADRLRRRDPALVEDPVRLHPAVLRAPRAACRRPSRSGRTRAGRGAARGCSPCPPSGPSSASPGPGGCRWPASGSIRWSSDLSGAAAEVLTGAGMWAAMYIRGSQARARGFAAFSAKFIWTSTSRLHGLIVAESGAPFARAARRARRDPLAGRAGRGSSRFRPPRGSRRRPAARARRRRSRRRPCRPPESAPRRRRARTCSSATPAPPGPRARRCRPRARAAAWPDRSRVAFSVLISETASAPPSAAATATAAGSATFGVSFTISGLSVSGRSASSSAAVSSGCSPTISPDWTLGQETLSSIAATSSRCRDAPRRAARTPRGSSPSPRRSAAPAAGQLRQVLLEESLEALVREPDRVDHPGRRLPEPRRRVSGARLRRDRLRDEGREREALEQRVAEGAPGGDRVEGARAVDDRVRESDPAELDRQVGASYRCPAPPTSAVSISSRADHRASTQSRM